MDLLPSINGINRPSFGSILYPVAVYGAFIMFELKGGSYLWFYAPILMMALCDPVAAWVGKNYPWKPYRVGHERKTLGGSLAFWAVGVLLMMILLYTLPNPWIWPIPVVAISLSAVAALVEGLSQRGTDNFWIPFIVLISMEALTLAPSL